MNSKIRFVQSMLIAKVALLAVLALTTTAAAQGWTDLGGGDHGGAPWAPAGGAMVAGVHTNVGAFSIGVGTTVNVQPYDGVSYGSFEVRASSITIDGILDATAAGFRGGAPGPAPGTYGLVGEGPGAGQGGYGDPANIYGRGGGGGGYGGAAGNAGTGGITISGMGGPAYGIAGLATSPPSDDDIEMGSGGGGGGQQSGGGICTPGGNGGGRVLLITSGDLILTGTIRVGGGTSLPTTATSGTGGGGSGGGVLLQGDLVNLAAGTIDASGGDSGNSGRYSGSGGGGGRIKIFWDDAASTVMGTFDVSFGAYGTTVFPPLTPSNPGTIFDAQTPAPVPPTSWSARVVAPTPDVRDKGTSFDVPLEITVGGAVLGTYAATMRFDPATFTATLVSAGSSPLGAPTTAMIDNPSGTITLAGNNAGMSMAATGALEVAIITFTASGNAGNAAVIGATIDTVLDLSAATIGAPTPGSATPTFVGIGLLLGDINLDGSVSILDALVMAQTAAGLISVPASRQARLAGDMDTDLDIDIIDALRAAQTSAGITPTLPLATALDPYIALVTPPMAAPSASITIDGEVFSFLIADLIVEIAGVPATILTASPTSLTVSIPIGVTPGPTTIVVDIYGRRSNAFPFTVN